MLLFSPTMLSCSAHKIRLLCSVLCQSISIVHYNFTQMLNITINIYFALPYFLELCLMLPMTRYAQNYAGIIGGSLLLSVTLEIKNIIETIDSR